MCLCMLVLLCVNSSDGVMWELLPLAHLQWWNLKPEVHTISHCPLLHFEPSSMPAEVHLGKRQTDLALHFKYRKGYSNENIDITSECYCSDMMLAYFSLLLTNVTHEMCCKQPHYCKQFTINYYICSNSYVHLAICLLLLRFFNFSLCFVGGGNAPFTPLSFL